MIIYDGNTHIIYAGKWKKIFLNFKCKLDNEMECLDIDHNIDVCWYCTKFYSDWDEVKLNVKDEEITFVPYYGDNEDGQRGWSSVAARMHPLVEKKLAIWITENTLLLGYTLKNNKEIFRPAFSRKRERYLNNVRLSIKKYVGQPEEGIHNIGNGFIRRIRQKLARRELLCIQLLPYEIIYKISSWI